MEVETLWLEIRKMNKHIGLEGLGSMECDLKKVRMSPTLEKTLSLVVFI
jgi:hypothetical protein